MSKAQRLEKKIADARRELDWAMKHGDDMQAREAGRELRRLQDLRK